MRSLHFVAALALAAAMLPMPSLAAEGPKNGDVVACNVSNLMPSAFFVQCGIFAGTVVALNAGGYWGMLVCKSFGASDCQEVVPASVDKTISSLKGVGALHCTLVDARDISARFTCTL